MPQVVETDHRQAGDCTERVVGTEQIPSIEHRTPRGSEYASRRHPVGASGLSLHSLTVAVSDQGRHHQIWEANGSLALLCLGWYERELPRNPLEAVADVDR